MVRVKKEDFKVEVPQELVDAINKEIEKTDKMEVEYRFCRDHNFCVKADAISVRINARTDVYVGICNALGCVFD